MDIKTINPVILNELYYFISDHYNDPALADYILNIFSIEREDFIKKDITYKEFSNILHYMQRISDQYDICYRAGRYFSEKKIFGISAIVGLKHSVNKTYGEIDRILMEFFPALKMTIEPAGRNSIKLSFFCNSDEININYYLSEYLKGIVAAVPLRRSLPPAEVTVIAYGNSIEDIFNDTGVEYRKEEREYFILDRVVAEEVLDTSGNNIQILKDDLYIRDVYIKKGVLLNSGSLTFKIDWAGIDCSSKLVFILSAIMGIPFLLLGYNNKLADNELLLCLFVLYETLIMLFYNLYAKKRYGNIYAEAEEKMLEELEAQRKITGEAVSNTRKRLLSIENLMEITKHIIHEKDISTLFDNIRKLTAKALNADRATVFIHDSEKKELSSGPRLSDESQEFRIPEDKGIAGQIFKLRKTVNVKDAYNHPYFDKSVDRQTGYETKTILGAPLLDPDNNLIGVIQVLNKAGGEFQEIDEQIIESLSTYIAIALKDTLTISRLEKQGIDPVIIEGIGVIASHLNNEFQNIQRILVDADDPVIDTVYPRMIDMSLLLEKLIFLFKKEYDINIRTVTIKDITESFRKYLEKRLQNSKTIYGVRSALPDNFTLDIDLDILERAAFELITNSIEAAGDDGEVVIRIYNFVELPRNVVHDLFLEDIMNDFNSLGSENADGFISMAMSRKPLLENELEIIRSNLKEYIAIDFYDSGGVVEKEIRNKIFHPFFSTKKRFGLGLAIAKRALLRLKGRIEEPVPKGEGKIIKILLPLNSEKVKEPS